MTAVATLTGALSHRMTVPEAPSAYGEGGATARCSPWHHRVPQGALARLERHEGKLSRAVLRGLGGSNPARLPGEFG